jgi:GT2 family glycosyltransferase
MDLSIVIVSYNVKEFLRGAIASIRRSLDAGRLSGEILVVDNDSSDGSPAMVRTEFPDVRLFASGENLGFGRANNLAMKESKGDYILLINPDTLVGEDTLRTVVDFMRGHPEAGLAGCKLLNGDGSFQLSCRRGFPTPWASFTKLFGLAGLFPNSKLFSRYNLTYLPVDSTYEVDALGGAFMMLSRKAWEATSGFDEAFFMYGEDIDLCFRAKEAGFKIFYVHSTATVHFKGESTRRSAINEVNVFYEAMHVFVKKHYRASFLFSLLLRLGIILRGAIALAKKYQGVISLAILDYLTIAFGVLLGSKALFGTWFGLPSWDYPYALIIPPLIAVLLLASLKAYRLKTVWSVRPVAIAIPAMLIGFSSLTYFFKEFPSSRVFVIVVTFAAGVLLVVERLVLRIVRRLLTNRSLSSLGFSSNSMLRKTLIIGADEESLRIAEMLKRMEFLRRYQVVGLIDENLERLDRELLPSIRILGDVNMVAKVVREQRISEVIFASNSVRYTEVLAIMQRTSDENPSMRVNFSMVPVASDVLLGRDKIEILTETSGSSVALLPVQHNLNRMSHRFSKRLLDIFVSGVALPGMAIAYAANPAPDRRDALNKWAKVFRGQWTLVGMEGAANSRDEGREGHDAKRSITSLAAVAAPYAWRGEFEDNTIAPEEDVRQFDEYYARNHTLGMDCEILLKRMFVRKSRGKGK